jgi:hypothetical protein
VDSDFVNTLRVDRETIDYFKQMADETGIPYQPQINLYLRDCAQQQRKLEMQRAGRATGSYPAGVLVMEGSRHQIIRLLGRELSVRRDWSCTLFRVIVCNTDLHFP